MKPIGYLLIIAVIVATVKCTESYETTEGGTAGSMARFAIKDNFLYTVDYDYLHVFDITTPANNVRLHSQHVGFGIETIFPTDSHLFLGARTGMYIYGLKNAARPNKISFTPHFESYDPVVVQGNIAYVTLRQDNQGGWGNMLQIYDISKLTAPELLVMFPMWGPRGLGVDGDKLFICDDKLKVYRLITPSAIELIQSFDIQAIDVIPMDEILYVIAEDGLYQYSYAGDTLTFISKITISP